MVIAHDVLAVRVRMVHVYIILSVRSTTVATQSRFGFSMRSNNGKVFIRLVLILFNIFVSVQFGKTITANGTDFGVNFDPLLAVQATNPQISVTGDLMASIKFGAELGKKNEVCISVCLSFGRW